MRPCNHDDYVPKCPVCELALRFPDRWSQPLPINNTYVPTDYTPNIDPGDRTPCKFRGKLVSLPDKHRLGLSVIRDWYPCSKGHGQGGYVCPCMGCNHACDDYVRGNDNV